MAVFFLACRKLPLATHVHSVYVSLWCTSWINCRGNTYLYHTRVKPVMCYICVLTNITFIVFIMIKCSVKLQVRCCVPKTFRQFIIFSASCFNCKNFIPYFKSSVSLSYSIPVLVFLLYCFSWYPSAIHTFAWYVPFS